MEGVDRVVGDVRLGSRGPMITDGVGYEVLLDAFFVRVLSR